MVEATGGLNVSSQEWNCGDSYLLEVGKIRNGGGGGRRMQCYSVEKEKKVSTSQQDLVLQKTMSVFQCHQIL